MNILTWQQVAYGFAVVVVGLALGIAILTRRRSRRSLLALRRLTEAQTLAYRPLQSWPRATCLGCASGDHGAWLVTPSSCSCLCHPCLTSGVVEQAVPAPVAGTDGAA